MNSRGVMHRQPPSSPPKRRPNHRGVIHLTMLCPNASFCAEGRHATSRYVITVLTRVTKMARSTAKCVTSQSSIYRKCPVRMMMRASNSHRRVMLAISPKLESRRTTQLARLWAGKSSTNKWLVAVNCLTPLSWTRKHLARSTRSTRRTLHHHISLSLSSPSLKRRLSLSEIRSMGQSSLSNF